MRPLLVVLLVAVIVAAVSVGLVAKHQRSSRAAAAASAQTHTALTTLLLDVDTLGTEYTSDTSDSNAFTAELDLNASLPTIATDCGKVAADATQAESGAPQSDQGPLGQVDSAALECQQAAQSGRDPGEDITAVKDAYATVS